LAEKQRERLVPMRAKLKAHRDQRKQPLLDTKIITSWNALMIRALAHGGKVLNEPRYTHAATTAADFLLREHRKRDGGLYRTSRDGVKKYDAFLDDYAFLAQALLALDKRDRAAEVVAAMVDKFGDEDGGFFFSDRSASDLIVRQKTASDSPLPAGNAVGALALLELGQTELAKRTLQAFAPQLERGVESMSSLLQVAMQYVRRHGPLEVAASANDETQRRATSPKEIAAGVVAIGAEMRDQSVMLVHLEVLDTFHINANVASQGLIPTTVTVTGVDAKDVEKIEYPPSEERRFAFSDSPVRVYEGNVTIAIHFRRPVTSETLTLNVTYQACDENACLPPVTKRVELELK
jgi:uncharacterized protein